MSSLSAIFDCFTPDTYDAFSAHRWLCQLKRHKMNFQRRLAAALYNTSSYRHRMQGGKKWLRRFPTKRLKCCLGTKSYGKSITTLSRGATGEFLYFVAWKDKKRMEKTDPDGTVRSLPLKCFRNGTPRNSDLRVTAKANQRDRPVRKAAV